MCEQAAAKLNELMAKIGVKPEYEIINSQTGTHINKFLMCVKCPIVPKGPICIAEGFGLSKKKAKHQAALSFMRIHLGDKNNSHSLEIRKINAPPLCAVNVNNSNRRMVLQTLCLKYNLGKPEFVEIGCTGPPHARHFTIECKISSFSSKGSGSSKSEARLQAITEMIQLLMQEQQVCEVFEAPRLTATLDSREIFCLNENLTGSQLLTPIGVYARRSSSSSSSNIYPASDTSSVQSFTVSKNTCTLYNIIECSNGSKKVENIVENSDDSAINMNLIDLNDNCQQTKIAFVKSKSKSLSNLADLSESQKTLFHHQPIKKIDTTLANVEKQLYKEILDTLENRDFPRQKNVIVLSHEFQVFVNHGASPKIFENQQLCNDTSIRIACLTKLLMDLRNHAETCEKEFSKSRKAGRDSYSP